MAGLFCGILLRRLGYEVEVYERAGEALASRGAGIATHRELYAAFKQAGVRIDRAMGVETAGRIAIAPDGTVLGTHPMPQIMTSWGLLYRFLRREYPDAHYHAGAVFADFSEDADGVTVRFEDGRETRADWLVAADGLHSSIRAKVLPAAVPEYAGYAAWRGLVDEAALPASFLEQLSGQFAFCLPEGEHMLGYLVAGPNDDLTPGRRWYNWVWYRPAVGAAALADLLTDECGRHHPLGIPHHLIRAEHIAKMRADAEIRVAPLFREAVRRTERPFLQPIYDFVSPRLVCGRVLLVGDAACTARPHIGLGVSKAADDAAKLAHAFYRTDVDRRSALADWEADRLRFARAAVKHSRSLGAYLGPAQTTPEGRALAEFNRRPETVMARAAATDPERYLEY